MDRLDQKVAARNAGGRTDRFGSCTFGSACEYSRADAGCVKWWDVALKKPKNSGFFCVIPQKWMVKIMENPMKIQNLGVPLFLETTMCQDDVRNDKKRPVCYTRDPETNSKSTWKWMVGIRLFPFSDGLCSGDMLISGSVIWPSVV